ncbi:Prolamin-like domain [Dillenia turbinata]|uniref:Prolamin-like domain n=1 Tax=Dillenia turbinata TaxID=194707 RepID=A0AAN8Z1H2_9MAGN
MSRRKNVTLMACFLVFHCALLSTPGLGGDDVADVPYADDVVGDGPTSDSSLGPDSVIGFLESCLKKISDCGVEIYNDIFEFEDLTPVSTPCCERLVKVAGRECHDTMVTMVLIKVKDAKKKEEFRKKSDETYTRCVSAIARAHSNS